MALSPSVAEYGTHRTTSVHATRGGRRHVDDVNDNDNGTASITTTRSHDEGTTVANGLVDDAPHYFARLRARHANGLPPAAYAFGRDYGLKAKPPEHPWDRD